MERGLLTERVLRGHRYRRLFKDIYLLASAPADRAAQSQGATLLVPGRGVLSGYSAAGCSVHDVHRRTRTPS